jgi:hypothetical protein
LGNKNVFLGLEYLEAKEIMQITKVFHFKFLLKLDFTWVKSLGSLPVRIRSLT